MYGHTYSKSMDQPGKVANPARHTYNGVFSSDTIILSVDTTLLPFWNPTKSHEEFLLLQPIFPPTAWTLSQIPPLRVGGCYFQVYLVFIDAFRKDFLLVQVCRVVSDFKIIICTQAEFAKK